MRAPGRALELHIHGDLGADAAYARRIRQIAGDDRRIFLHGRFDNTQVASILSRVDVVVVPSTCYENSPLVILEARASGTPLVVAALGGMPELVENGVNGLHCRPADAADLARKLQRLIDEPGLLPRLRAGVVRPRSVEDEMLHLTAIDDRLVAQPGR